MSNYYLHRHIELFSCTYSNSAEAVVLNQHWVYCKYMTKRGYYFLLFNRDAFYILCYLRHNFFKLFFYISASLKCTITITMVSKGIHKTDM